MSKDIILAGTDIVSDSPMQHYLLAQSRNKKPKIAFLPTASGDDPGVIRSFFQNFQKHYCEPDFLPLFYNKEKDLREFILKQDIILVGGGHSKSMKGVLIEWGLDKILKEAYENGVILAGGSAGSVIWVEEAITDSFAGELRPMNFLGLLPFSHCPHYRSGDRRQAYKSAILARKMKPGYGVGDGAAIHFRDGEVLRAVSSDQNASCFYVDIDSSGKEERIKSERLESSWLCSKVVQEELIWPTPAFEYISELVEEAAKPVEAWPGEIKTSEEIVQISP